MLRTKDLEIELSFSEALKWLEEGNCIGIRPKGNANFIIKTRMCYNKPDSKRNFIMWKRTKKEDRQNGDQSIRIEQYLDTWNPVVLDCNELPEKMHALLENENISNDWKEFQKYTNGKE